MYRGKCQRNHYSEVCDHLEACKATKTCKKKKIKKVPKTYTEKGLEVNVHTTSVPSLIKVNQAKIYQQGPIS